MKCQCGGPSRPGTGNALETLMLLKNRAEAGRELAEQLKDLMPTKSEVCVLALPKGGVPVAFEISRRFHWPLDLLFVKKIGLPGQEELAIGAVTEGKETFWLREAFEVFDVSPEKRTELEARAHKELQRQTRRWRRRHPRLEVKNKTVIVVDDGLATGATMKAALQLLRHRGVEKLIVAVPVGSPATVNEVKKLADEVVVLRQPSPFFSVGQWYSEFNQVSEEEVAALFERGLLPGAQPSGT